MPKKQSIFRQPNAQHFQLVHRSQRDPLVHDADAPQRLFKEVGRLNDKQKTGQTLAELERSLQASSSSSGGKSLKNPPLRPNEGEATLYGVYYDDTEYDYMQHLRGMEVDDQRNAQADEAVFVSAPRGGSTAIGNRGAGGRRDVKNPRGATDEFESMFKKGQMVRMPETEDQVASAGTTAGSSKPTLPSTVLPSSTELSYQKAIESTRAIPTELTGFRPDMDPHLRQVLEALEDDAFVQVDDEDDLFSSGAVGGASGEDWIGELLGGGERGEDEGDLEDEFEFREEGIEDDGRPSWIAPHLREQGAGDDEDKPEETWQDRFQAFKASGGLARPSSPPPNAASGNNDDDLEEAGSERADTLASLRSFAPTVNGAKNRRRKGGSRAGGSQASGYSMSSSSMFRNKGLTVLDERFEKIERDYEDEGDFDEDDFPSSEWMSEAGGEGEGMDDDNASIASFATATTFTRMLRKQQAAQSNEDTKEVSREDFEAIMDDFLDNYEVVGKKMVQVLPGRDGAEKLDSMRKALVGLDLEGNGPVGGVGGGQGGDDEDDEGNLAGGTKREADYIRQRYLREDYYSKRGEEEEKMPMLHIVGQGKEDKWDAETILSTYSNLENHPRMIGVAKREKKKGSSSASTATTSTTSNIPTSIASSSSSSASRPEVGEEAEPALEDFASSRGGDDEVDSDAETVSSDGTVRAEPRAPPVRPRGESAQDKKARKLAVKAERSARRVEKKTRQETFGMERKTQLKGHERAVGSGRASDLTALASGGTGTVNVVRL